MYLFLGIFPSCRPKAIRKKSRDCVFRPEDKRKEEKTLSSFYFLSLSLSVCVSSQRDHARESVVPSLSVVVVVVVVVNVTTRLREREDVCVITHYFTFQKKVQKVKSPPRVNETNKN